MLTRRLIVLSLVCWGCDDAPVSTQSDNGTFEVWDGGGRPLDAQLPEPAPDAAPPPPDIALPACIDGLDNDGDGLVDFPVDPGCASTEDVDERNSPADRLPICQNGLDDDHDGQIDLEDPGCAAPRDEDERNPDAVPPCANGEDDDQDGFVDYPQDPGCVGAGHPSELDPDPLPECGNNLDDDGDGLIDFPFDPGCAARSGPTELDGALPDCANGLDDDDDGRADYPLDLGCVSAADRDEGARCDAIEAPLGEIVRGDTRRGDFRDGSQCGGQAGREIYFTTRFNGPAQALVFETELDGTDVLAALSVRRRCDMPNTELTCVRAESTGGRVRIEEPEAGDYVTVVDGLTGTGGPVVLRVTAIPLEACRNGLDDDGDARIDYPDDPGCDAFLDPDETSPDPLPACADGLDNDGDNLFDYPQDVGCTHAADDDEFEPCGQGVAVFDYPADAGFIAGEPGSDAHGGVCGGFASQEWVVRYVNAATATLTLTADPPGRPVYVRSACRRIETELGCSTQPLVLEDVAPGIYYVVVEAEGPARLSIRADRGRAGCDDGDDNDLDGLVDVDDPGCMDAADDDELDEGVRACADGADNDGDGLVDWPLDPGCSARGDDDEAGGPGGERAACANGVDDDGDGRIDHPLDRGCAAPGDTSESAPTAQSECGDGIDNDGNSVTDWPFDAGCSGLGDLSETTVGRGPACSNGIDDDRDGLVDFPLDPGCLAAGEDDERGVGACSDGLDNDGDGIIDFPYEPGCFAAGDDDEMDPILAPRCSNQVDDDRDGLQDWPAETGCAHAADDDESGSRPSVCMNGIDDDGDGRFDLADPGCARRDDGSEVDPEEMPRCLNGLDDDGDGAVDWPTDLGCFGAGDVCEVTGFGLCGGACLDLLNDASNCGRCGRVCDGECLGGRCGGLRSFAGVRTDVPDVELSAWRRCYFGRYDESGAQLSDLALRCDGELMMWGCREVGADDWSVLAMGRKTEMMRVTGGSARGHNGVVWYLSETGSMGFAPDGQPVRRQPCDAGPGAQDQRLCWLTRERTIVAGARCGARTRLEGSAGWERAVWTR